MKAIINDLNDTLDNIKDAKGLIDTLHNNNSISIGDWIALLEIITIAQTETKNRKERYEQLIGE